MNEMAAADRWLYGVLSQMGTAYNGCVPKDGTYPCIVYACLGGSDLNVPAQHIWNELTYIVKVWGTVPEDSLYETVCAALERQADVTTEHGYIQSCQRQSVRADRDIEDGVTYYSREATFRIRVKPGITETEGE